GKPKTDPATSMNRAGGPSASASPGSVCSTQSSGSCRWASTSMTRTPLPFSSIGGLQDRRFLLIGEGVELLHMHESHVIPPDATHLVEPVMLAEHLSETGRVAVQHLGIDLLRFQAPQ